jgi:outer membrane protein OmpA-like peptidoglycan-associated protein
MTSSLAALVLTTLLAASAAGSAPGSASGSAPAADNPPTAPPGISQVLGSVTLYLPQGSVRSYSTRGSVTSLASVRSSGGSTVLSLGTDVLFSFGSGRLSPQADAALARRLTRIPRRSTVSITGYTDSIGSPPQNLALSRRRAQAVAAAVTRSRPDLRVSATGRGEADPVAPNTAGGVDNPAGRARNRRVELRWPS